jgi:hypothetical protein
MRLLFIPAVILILSMVSDGARADWCAVYRNGGGNCGFATFQQCMATVSGIGGFCNGSPSSNSQTSETSRRATSVAHLRKREAQQQPRRERIHQAKAKPPRQIAKRHVPSEEPAENRGTKLSPGDDDHIVPAEPD